MAFRSSACLCSARVKIVPSSKLRADSFRAHEYSSISAFLRQSMFVCLDRQLGMHYCVTKEGFSTEISGVPRIVPLHGFL